MKLLRIGLTGGIASGKSQVAQLFSEHSIEIIDADKIARNLFKPGEPILKSLKQKFGSTIFNSDSSINRKALGKIVFNSRDDLIWLNQLTHPLVSKEITRQLDLVKSKYVILDIPLLIDKQGNIPIHLSNFIDRVLVIDVPLETQIRRLCQRDKISTEEALSIISNQSTLAQKLALADDIIDNHGHIDSLFTQVEQLHQQYSFLQSKESK